MRIPPVPELLGQVAEQRIGVPLRHHVRGETMETIEPHVETIIYYNVKQMATELLLGSLEHIVLLAVARLGDDAYGMRIRREIEARTGRDLSIGAVYTTLERLEKKGFVSSFTGEPTAERGGRAKRHFSLEAGGERALTASQAALRSMSMGLRKAWTLP